MIKKVIMLALFSGSIFCGTVQSKIDPKTIKEKMQWFADAKLGIFIHSGIYAVNGIGESWSFHNKEISHANYMKQLKGFTLKKYEPAVWADLLMDVYKGTAIMPRRSKTSLSADQRLIGGSYV